MPGGVAARVAGWQRRLGGQAGPLGAVSAGSGESPSGSSVQVELYIGGLWVDITSLVLTRDGGGNVSITRGRANEGSKTDPSTCRFQLNNRDGRFSPRNPLTPYFGVLGRNTPLRVSVQSGLDKSYRFWGEVASWPQKSDPTGTDVWVDIEAAGILRRLGQGSSPLGSTMYLALSSLAGAGTVVAYWPCEDASSSTLIASALGGAPMAIQGTPTLASSTAFVCSTALPVMADGSFTGTVPTYTTSAAGDFDAAVRFLLALPAAGSTSGQVVCRSAGSGTIRAWEVYYTSGSGGYLGVRCFNSAGTLISDSGAGAGPVDGLLLQVTMDLYQLGPDVGYDLFLQQVGTSGVGFGVSGTASSSTLGLLTSVSMAPGRGLTNAVIGHVSVQTGGLLISRTQELNAYSGETAAARIQRMCTLAGIGYEQIGTASSTVAMGTQASSTIVDLIDQAVVADGGVLYEQTGALGLGYRTRISMENQPAALALSYTAANLADPLNPVDDDQITRNDITVTRTGGSSARATLTSGALSVLPPPAGVGTYPDSPNLNVQSDSTLADQAGWRLHLGTVDEARYPKISVNLAHPSFATSTTFGIQALGLRPGDRLTISDLPASLPPDNVSQLVLGYSETLDNFQHRLAWNCAPESPYRVAVADDATYGRADTDGSSLAADAGPADTALSVVTTPGAPLWVTTLWNPAEFPFDVRAGGEVMTVSGISSAISDSFTRTVSNGWGTADTGQAWTTNGGSAGDYAVTGNAGTHSAASVNVFRVTTAPMPQADFDVRVSFMTTAFPASDSEYVFLVARFTDANNFYFARVQLAPTTGAMTLNIRKRTTAGGEVLLSTYTTSLTFSAGALYWVRLSGTGSALSAKVWADGSPEPDWQTSATDSDITVVGSAGVRTLLGAANTNTLPVTFTFDNFEFLNVQTMQVTRSVNGVVKPQPLGTDVRLNQPATAAL